MERNLALVFFMGDVSGGWMVDVSACGMIISTPRSSLVLKLNLGFQFHSSAAPDWCFIGGHLLLDSGITLTLFLECCVQNFQQGPSISREAHLLLIPHSRSMYPKGR